MTSATTPFFIINPQNKKNISNDAFLYSILFKLYFTFFHAFNLEHSIITVFCWLNVKDNYTYDEVLCVMQMFV